PSDAEIAIRLRCTAVGAPFLTPSEEDRTGSDAGEPHDRANAATARAVLAALRTAGWELPREQAERGMTAVRLPGRTERFAAPLDDAGRPCGPAALLDVAHNWASAGALARTLQSAPERGRKSLALACAKDKDAAGLIRTLAPVVDDLTLTRFVANPRAVEPHRLAALARSITDMPIRCEPDPRLAWENAVRRCGPDGLAVAAGSFFLIAELRPLALGRRAAGG
ncbi:MAG: hypothetical protein AAF907_17010, partial [Planctomycetota bacterium]